MQIYSYFCRRKSHLQMNNESVREKFKGNPRLKRFVDWLIMNQVETRPRWYVRMLAPLYQHRGRHSVIHRSVRMDTPPYRQFRLGSYSVIESGACINNAGVSTSTWIDIKFCFFWSSTKYHITKYTTLWY